MLRTIAAALALLCLTQAVSAKPNIILILTDDQESRTDDTGTISAMPNVRDLLMHQGLTFTSAWAEQSVCGPARASMLTGQASHNHGIVVNDTAYQLFQTREAQSLGPWLQAAGYRTALIGKFMNGYEAYAGHEPPGWDEWDALSRRVQGYFDYDINENGATVTYGTNEVDYSTDVISGLATDFISRQSASVPFFLMLTPNAIHDALGSKGPIPAPRHAGMYAGVVVPQYPDYAEKNVSDKPPFVQALPQIGQGDTDRMSAVYEKRLEAAQAVDDMVGAVMAQLAAQGLADNTYVIYASDNGFDLGSHRWSGKNVVYNESTAIPLVIRGPGVDQWQTRDALISNLDIPATILDLAGASASNPLDGVSLRPLFASATAPWRTAIGEEGTFSTSVGQVTFQTMRTPRFVYSQVTDSNGTVEEFYDLVSDPYALRSNPTAAKYTATVSTMRAALPGLASCQGPTCGFSGAIPEPSH